MYVCTNKQIHIPDFRLCYPTHIIAYRSLHSLSNYSFDTGKYDESAGLVYTHVPTALVEIQLIGRVIFCSIQCIIYYV